MLKSLVILFGFFLCLPAEAQTSMTRAQLEALINADIIATGKGQITGPILNSVLNNIAASTQTLLDPLNSFSFSCNPTVSLAAPQPCKTDSTLQFNGSQQLGISSSAVLPNGVTATTQSGGDTSSKVATDLFVQNAIGANQPVAGIAILKAAIVSQEGTNTPAQNGAMGSPPTVTNTSTITGLTNCFTWNDVGEPFPAAFYGGKVLTQQIGSSNIGRFFPVATVFSSGGNIGVGGQVETTWRMESNITSAKFAFEVPNSSVPYRVIVNGSYVNLTGDLEAIGGFSYLVYDFTSIGGSANRDIILESSQNTGFMQVCMSPGDTITYPINFTIKSYINPLQATIGGDSITAGTGPTLANDGPIQQLTDRLGISDDRASGIGGSGLTNNGAGSLYVLGQRLQDIESPYIDMMAMGVNDIGTSESIEQAAATTALTALRLQNPNTVLIAIGPYDTAAPGPPVTGYAAIKTAIQTACSLISDCFFVDLQGIAYATIDGTHPTTAGATTLSNAMYAEIKADLGVP